MRKALRIISKVFSMVIGIIYLAMCLFEFMLVLRADASLFEDVASGTWLYVLRGLASLSAFLLSLSLLLFPKKDKALANLIASSGLAIITIVSYPLMETYVYIPLLVMSLLCLALFTIEFFLSKKEGKIQKLEEIGK